MILYLLGPCDIRGYNALASGKWAKLKLQRTDKDLGGILGQQLFRNEYRDVEVVRMKV